jgi:mRNA interferase MazF
VVKENFFQPDRGDFIFLNFSPHAGTEQAGRRPALVLSPKAFNIATGLAFVCPLTNQVKGSSFEVSMPKDAKLTGVVLCDHLRSFDWIERKAEFHSKAPQDVIFEVLIRIEAILSIEAG